MADFRLGRLKFNWRGAWTPNTAYVIDDIVKIGANTYVCIENHTSTTAESVWLATDSSKWSLHAEGINHRGDWTITTFYNKNDIVKYGCGVNRDSVAARAQLGHGNPFCGLFAVQP